MGALHHDELLEVLNLVLMVHCQLDEVRSVGAVPHPSTTRLGLSTRQPASPLCGVDGLTVTTPDRRLQHG